MRPQPGDGQGWCDFLNQTAETRVQPFGWPTIPFWDLPRPVSPSDPAWRVALQMLGSPFLHMGRGPYGVDCVGLLIVTGWAKGLHPTDNHLYGREPDYMNGSFGLLDYLRKNCGPPVSRPPKPNDVVAMKLKPRFAPTHVGILAPHKWGMVSGETTGLALIHSYGEIGCVAYHRMDERRAAQIVEVYEWPEKL